ncbi:hypothetical protein [Agromyces silvae]|uniref:hypothetical protein n=1 Tax=Agromyces silvae TaxID=3388266 RepID=UPI00280ABA48|nr:hypothetical protein [Agromyces protaetiae]
MSIDQHRETSSDVPAPQGAASPDADTSAFEPFAVDHLILNDLPFTLGTVDAPERYTVTAVFTRRPLPLELELLAKPETQILLAEAGYPAVSLTTADRRLFIVNTNLSELRQGLAQVIGRVLDDIGTSVAKTRTEQAQKAAELAHRAAERVQRVFAEAEQIDFSPNRAHYT